jgi:DNA polymerase-3 subunit delta'
VSHVDSLPNWLEVPLGALMALHERGVHAVLLHGPAGTGKWRLAMQFAQACLCDQPVRPGMPCGHCASCQLFVAGNHPDLRVTVPDALAERRPGRPDDDEPASTADTPRTKPSRDIKIDAVRDLSGLFQISAHRGGTRVVVLGPSENLTLPAANALLKNLEEPPPQTLFVLVSDQIDQCLPTIRSRCSLLRVSPPDDTQAQQWLITQGVPAARARQSLIQAGGAPLLARQRALDGDNASSEAEAILPLLRAGGALTVARIASQVPRQVLLPESLAIMQRWAWDLQAVALGADARYFPDDGAQLQVLASTMPSWTRVDAWHQHLQSLQATAEHPLNGKSCVEGALIAYANAWNPAG